MIVCRCDLCYTISKTTYRLVGSVDDGLAIYGFELCESCFNKILTYIESMIFKGVA